MPRGAAAAIVLIVAIGVVGLLLIVMLMAAWRRHNARLRQSRDRREPAAPAQDIWHVSGQRLNDPPADDQT